MLSFFPRDVLDEIWDLIESVSEGFLTYSCFHVLLGVLSIMLKRAELLKPSVANTRILSPNSLSHLNIKHLVCHMIKLNNC